MKTLKEELKLFKRILADQKFLITLDDGKSFVIQFKTYNFPHLIGLGHCAEGKLKKQFSGNKANASIEKGELTFERLKTINQKMYEKYIIGKLEGFELFINLFPNKPNLFYGIVFDSSRVIETVDRNLEKAKLIIQDKTNPNVCYIFLFGEEKNNGSNILYPLSIRRETSSTINYLDLQEKHQIKEIKKI